MYNTKLSKQRTLTDFDDITEPLTLSEVKEYLRLNNFLDDSIEKEIMLNSDQYSPGTFNSGGIDRLNKTSIVNINAGVFVGEAIVKIQHSNDDINYYDWYTFSTIDSSNDESIHTKEYTGTRQYIKVNVVVSDDVCDFSIDCALYNYDVEDNTLNDFISTAREFGEDYTMKKFASVSVEKKLNRFSSNLIEWEYKPLSSVTEFKYKDIDGNETVLVEDTDYVVDTLEGVIYTPPNTYFPTIELWNFNAITITAICGYTSENLPRQFKTAMLLHIGLMYNYRGEAIPPENLNTVYRYYNLRRENWF